MECTLILVFIIHVISPDLGVFPRILDTFPDGPLIMLCLSICQSLFVCNLCKKKIIQVTNFYVKCSINTVLD